MLVEAARRLDPPRLRQAVGHLVAVADPDREEGRAERRHQRRGLWLSPTWDGMVAIDGLLEPEAGQTVLAALEPLARPADAHDDRSGGQRTADALTELARRHLEAGRLPKTGGVRPQLLVTVELDSLLGRPGSLAGDLGGVGPLDPEACRRLACDSAVTRVLVTRHPHRPPASPATILTRRSTLAFLADRQTTMIPAIRPAWPDGCERRRPSSPRSWVAPPPSRWMWGGPAGSSPPPNAPPWPSVTAAVSSRAAAAPWPGARLIISCTGWMAAPPIWPTWCCCAARIIGRSMRAAGGWADNPTGP